MSKLPKPYIQFQETYREVWQAYEALGTTAALSGPLDLKTRELIKLGMAAARGSMSAVHSHTHRALEASASAEEITHTVLLGVTTLGFPSMMKALTWVQDAIKHHHKGE